MSKKSDLLRNQEHPTVLGYELDRKTLKPLRLKIDMSPGDYGADPVGDGTFKMVPSGDIVSFEERNRRMALRKNTVIRPGDAGYSRE